MAEETYTRAEIEKTVERACAPVSDVDMVAELWQREVDEVAEFFDQVELREDVLYSPPELDYEPEQGFDPEHLRNVVAIAITYGAELQAERMLDVFEDQLGVTLAAEGPDDQDDERNDVEDPVEELYHLYEKHGTDRR